MPYRTYALNCYRSGETATGDKKQLRRRSSSRYLSPRLTSSKVCGDLGKREPMDACMAIEIVNQTLVHQQHLRTSAHVRVNSHGKHCVVVLSINPIKLISPHLLNVAGVDETVTIGRFFNEHHRRQVIQIPVRRNLDEVGLAATH